ncbi:MAG TPA: hypothetical protein EYN66_21180 [Myxococcales bacterium]|nr:hypothetical protein [Myxococcales bacterium]
MRYLLSLLFILAGTAFADSGRFSKGRMSLGVGAGGGSGSFVVSGNYGYFVVDRLRPDIGLSYQYQDFGNANAQQIRGNLSLRYYLVDADPISPFLITSGGIIQLIHSGAGLDDSFTYYSVAGGLGGNMRLSRTLAMEVVVGGIQYLGVAQELLDREAVDEGVNFWWNLGLQISF